MSGAVRSAWDEHVLPYLIEKACRSSAILDERRRAVPGASGRVLEVGVGSGLNLSFYDATRVTELIGIDPSAPLLERARARLADAPVPVSLVRGSAEALPFDAQGFDSVVLTYTLCSIERPLAALREVRRVLKANGQLHFVEHGLSPDPAVERWQRRITPVWRRVGGNCHLTRDVPRELGEAGFELAISKAGYAGDGFRWFSYTYEGVAR